MSEETPFGALLQDIGRGLEVENVRYMKFLLQGHINRETLQYLDSGEELTEALRARGLVSQKRLAFLRKLLVEAKCLRLVNLVDNFRERFSPGVSFGDKDANDNIVKRDKKRESILRMIERLEVEISSSEDGETELTNETKQYEVHIQSNNERLVQKEDEIQKLKETISGNNAVIESCGRKLETVRFFLKKSQVELDKVKKALEQNKDSTELKMEWKEKMEKYEKGKKEEDELLAKHQKALDDIRSIHVEIRHRTEEMIKLEDFVHDCIIQIRVVKQNIRKNQRMRMEMHEKLENLTQELSDTTRLNPLTPALSSRGQRGTPRIPYRESQQNAEGNIDFKILDYHEITDRESTVIGRKGKGTSPPHFNTPVGIGVDRWGKLYVADYGNARVQVLDIGGKTVREPLNIGGKCRPCALAVSHRGDLVMTDSHIVRVFNRKGEFVRPILPIYSKHDPRPDLCSLAIDDSSNIYIGDRANHRIQKFNYEGQFQFFIGSSEELCYPIGIAVTKHGDVIVSDNEKHQLKVFFHEDLTRPKTIGANGIGICKFAFPRGIALDKEENILVADSQNHRIQVITIEGQYIGSFGNVGDDPGCFNTPYDVAIDTSGNVLVADTKNHRVQIFTRIVQVCVIYNRDQEENKEPLEGMGGGEEEPDRSSDSQSTGCVDDYIDNEGKPNVKSQVNIDTDQTDTELAVIDGEKTGDSSSYKNTEVTVPDDDGAIDK
ncbi:predicted protein [Nematostella vectensis]|uniref:DED domain-containing protein n=1 Tax=Nematostella vectensis TaxID=45351 RepID=A7SE63_NEMVE|nr:uncharacterized protein LOC5509508 [Nematostella vectensis]EDO37983.1 predicted protein [Nematostella vectensis]|eukprot:XP_001630046.1 predicted protein [Nematostella vectensis]